MVYYSGSRNARNAASITNRPTCGGNKKGGLAPTVGHPLSALGGHLIRATNTQQFNLCIPNRTIQTQKYGYHAVHGGNMG